MKAGNDYPVGQKTQRLEIRTTNEIQLGNVIAIMEFNSPLVSNCTFVCSLSVTDKDI